MMQTNFDDFRALYPRNFLELTEGSESAQNESSTKFDSKIRGSPFKFSRSFAGAKIKMRNFVAFRSLKRKFEPKSIQTHERPFDSPYM